MRYVIGLLALAFASASGAQVDNATINRIIDEELNQSELPQTAAYLTDRIGGRMTNSPAMRAAEQWTQQQFKTWDSRTCAPKASTSAAAGRSSASRRAC